MKNKTNVFSREQLKRGTLYALAFGLLLTILLLLAQGAAAQPDLTVPRPMERLRDLPFPAGVDLQFIIEVLATDLDLNVLFDSQSPAFRAPRKITIKLKNVTAAKALDYIFLQENLFFQKVGSRTILVTDQSSRQRFQQLVLRTFYLAKANSEDVAKIVQTAIPAQPGRTPTIPLIDKSTNSITIRDTSENVRIIGNLIQSLDKDRSEVVMDVQIYEVSKSDSLKLGNQFGDSTSLVNLGSLTNNVGLIIPTSTLTAYQKKDSTKLIASTQIHAFNNEDSSARIGQRVPVRTASYNTSSTSGTNSNNDFVGDVITYEQTGLTLKFKPIVFPNKDVQVAMEIESKDVLNSSSLTPTFSERSVKGTARVENNKTLLLMSIAQGSESKRREGLPFLGSIPLLGRLFTAPSKSNSQIDIVIAITPRVIRAPSILPDDEIERPTGSLSTPTNSSLEAMIVQEENEERLAAARRLPTTTVQLPDRKMDEPAYAKSNSSAQTTENQTAIGEDQTSDSVVLTQVADTLPRNLRPIDTSGKPLQIIPIPNTSPLKTLPTMPTSDTSPAATQDKDKQNKNQQEKEKKNKNKKDAPKLAGKWKLNAALSDDAQTTMQEMMKSRGGGMGQGGSRQGGGSPNSEMPNREQMEARREPMERSLDAPTNLEIEQSDTEIIISETGGSDRTRAFYIDGRKTEPNDVAGKAKLKKSQLIVETESDENLKIVETYELSEDGKQLIVNFKVEGGFGGLKLRRVYDFN